MPDTETTTRTTQLDHAAAVRLRNDVQRDAARAREAETYDVVEHVQQDASETEDQSGAERHHDAF